MCVKGQYKYYHKQNVKIMFSAFKLITIALFYLLI